LNPPRGDRSSAGGGFKSAGGGFGMDTDVRRLLDFGSPG
jgi:hypothetical protein